MKGKGITPLQRVFGFLISFLCFIHAYQSWMDGRKVSFLLYGLGGVLLLIMYTASLIKYVKKRREKSSVY